MNINVYASLMNINVYASLMNIDVYASLMNINVYFQQTADPRVIALSPCSCNHGYHGCRGDRASAYKVWSRGETLPLLPVLPRSLPCSPLPAPILPPPPSSGAPCSPSSHWGGETWHLTLIHEIKQIQSLGMRSQFHVFSNFIFKDRSDLPPPSSILNEKTR